MELTKEQAIERLRQCATCRTWRTDPECDHCWISEHRCPPTLVATTPKAVAALKRAIEIGKEAERTLREIRQAAR